MQVKIRPTDRRHRGYKYEWQPVPSYNGKWYGLNSKNIIPDCAGKPEDRRANAEETNKIKNLLFQKLPVQTRAAYVRETHTLQILRAKEVNN